MFLMNEGMLMLTGQPCIHVGLAQSRQRLASVIACSRVRPMLTSSVRVVARYTGSNSGITIRSIKVRSLAFMLLRNSSRHSALRSVKTSSGVSVSISLASRDSNSSATIVLSLLHLIGASKWLISSCSTRRKEPARFNISSKST